MIVTWLVATLHLLGLGIGLGAIWARARALGSKVLDTQTIERAMSADNWWGIASLIWIPSGLYRAFGGIEKGTTYYLANHAFHAKMGLLFLLFALEFWQMFTFIIWRMKLAKGEQPDTSRARLFSYFSYAEAAGIVGMVLAATAMARGMGG